MRCRILRMINKIVIRLRGSVGWCAVAYQFNRNGLPEETDEHGTWAEITSQGIIRSWWDAFMFRWESTEE